MSKKNKKGSPLKDAVDKVVDGASAVIGSVGQLVHRSGQSKPKAGEKWMNLMEGNMDAVQQNPRAYHQKKVSILGKKHVYDNIGPGCADPTEGWKKNDSDVDWDNLTWEKKRDRIVAFIATVSKVPHPGSDRPIRAVRSGSADTGAGEPAKPSANRKKAAAGRKSKAKPAAVLIPPDDEPIVTFELEGDEGTFLRIEMKNGGYFLMNFPFAKAKTEEEKANGVMCAVEPAQDRRGTTMWNLYARDIPCGTIPGKYLYDDDAMADLAMSAGPPPSTPSAAAAHSRNDDSDDDGDFLGMLQDELDKVKAQNKERKKETRALGDLVMQHAEDIRTGEKRLLHVEAEQEGLKDDLKEVTEDLKRRLDALEG